MIQSNLGILDSKHISLLLGKRKKKKERSRYRSHLLSLIYAMHLGKMCSSEPTPAAMQSTGSFLAITHVVVHFSCYSKYPNAKSSIQRHHVEFWHSQHTQGLEADEWIIMRYKYSIFNPDRYELVPIIFFISCKIKWYGHWSTKEAKTWQI